MAQESYLHKHGHFGDNQYGWYMRRYPLIRVSILFSRWTNIWMMPPVPIVCCDNKV